MTDARLFWMESRTPFHETTAEEVTRSFLILRLHRALLKGCGRRRQRVGLGTVSDDGREWTQQTVVEVEVPDDGFQYVFTNATNDPVGWDD